MLDEAEGRTPEFIFGCISCLGECEKVISLCSIPHPSQKCVKDGAPDSFLRLAYEGLPEFDAVAFGVGDPGEAAEVVVVAFGVDGDACCG